MYIYINLFGIECQVKMAAYLKDPKSGIYPAGFDEDRRWSQAFLRSLLRGEDVPPFVTATMTVDGMPRGEARVEYPALPEEVFCRKTNIFYINKF